MGLQQTIGNSAGIIGGQIDRITASDGRYIIGHDVSHTTTTLAACSYAATYLLLRRLNKKKEGDIVR